MLRDIMAVYRRGNEEAVYITRSGASRDNSSGVRENPAPSLSYCTIFKRTNSI